MTHIQNEQNQQCLLQIDQSDAFDATLSQGLFITGPYWNAYPFHVYHNFKNLESQNRKLLTRVVTSSSHGITSIFVLKFV